VIRIFIQEPHQQQLQTHSITNINSASLSSIEEQKSNTINLQTNKNTPKTQK
jgi:hypothetical protein